MSFFFADTKITIPLQQLNEKVYNCDNCPLHNNEHVITKGIEPNGSNNPLIYVVGDAPTYYEDADGEVFLGEYADLVKSEFDKYIDLDNFRFNNLLGCRPASKTGPTRKIEKEEILCCRERLYKDIEETKPLVIVGLGYYPLNAFLGGKRIEMWRGRLVPIKIKDHVCWYYPVFSPKEFLLKEFDSRFESKEKQCFSFDIKQLLEYHLSDNYYESPEVIDSGFEDNIEIILGRNQSDFDRIKNRLEELKKLSNVKLDIETTKLKPYYPNAKLATIAIGTFEYTLVFPIYWPTAWEFKPALKEELMKLLKDFILHSGVKFAFNLKFELEWFFYVFGLDKNIIYGTEWGDTEAKAYVINEVTSKKEGMLNLDVTCQQYLGVNLKKLNSKIDRKNILKSKLKDVLLYNGMDTKYTDKLDLVLTPKMDEDNWVVYNRLVEASKSLAICQAEGLVVDVKELKDLQKDYNSLLKEVYKSINSDKRVIKYTKTNGQFNPLSPKQVLYIFKVISGYDCTDEDGEESTDNETLSRFVETKEDKLASDILDCRELTKAKSTYLDSIYVEENDTITTSIAVDKRLHPEYNLMFVSTGRLSSGKGDDG